MNLEMAKRLFKCDDIVIVRSNLDKTNRAFSATSEMHDLIGKKIRISSVGWSGSSDKPPYISAAG